MNGLSAQAGSSLALRRPLLLIAAVVPCICLGAPAVTTPPSLDPLHRPATLGMRAEVAVLLAVTRAGGRLVAVGERGTILLSDDQGVHWRQVGTPVSVTLTAVSFADTQHGWAVGHGQVVLRTVDSGQTWQRQLDGLRASQIELESAKADPVAGPLQLKTAQRLASEGADKPFLDVHFFDKDHGIVVGAYGATFATDDGGASWRSRRGDLDNTAGRHLYRIHARGSELYLAGEQGALYRAAARDGRFASIKTPYAGTFFGVVASRQGDLIAYGLRGNVWRKAAGGESWVRVDTPAPVTVTGGALLADGSLVVVDEAGKLLGSSDDGQKFQPLPGPLRTASLTSVVQAEDGGLIVTSARGVVRIAPAAAVKQTKP